MTELIERRSLDRVIKRVVTQLQKHSSTDVTLMMSLDGSTTSAESRLKGMRFLRESVGIENVIGSIVYEACSSAEARAACSLPILAAIVQRLGGENHSADGLAACLDNVRMNSEPITRESMRRCMSSMPQWDIVEQAIELAGSECKIFVEPNTSSGTIIERIDGCVFNLAVDTAMMVEGRWAQRNVSCLIVDGIIERIAEIDRILQACNERKSPMIIFARGMSEDVRMTLRTNFLRRTLNVVSADVPFGLETANTLSDIAACIGCDVISSLKGELISTKALDDLGIAQSISIKGSVVTIVNNSRHSLALHTKMLREKRKNETIPDIKRVIDRRLRSLSSSSVAIRVDDAGSRGAQMMREIDTALLTLKSLIRDGTISRERLSTALELLPIKNMQLRNDVYPTATAISAITGAISLHKQLSSIGVALVDDIT